MERELDYKAIGKRIKIARIKADMKQERLAEKSGLSPLTSATLKEARLRSALPPLSTLPTPWVSRLMIFSVTI